MNHQNNRNYFQFQIIVLEKTSSIEHLSIASSFAQGQGPPGTPKANNVILSPLASQTGPQSFGYMKCLVKGLIDLFEKHFYNTTNCFSKSCVKIYEILTNYLEINYFPAKGDFSSPFPSQQIHPSFFNYYAEIRLKIFEFLFRIRSHKNNKMILLNRNERRKFVESKHLVLHLK